MDREYAELIVLLMKTVVITVWVAPLLLMIFIATRRKWWWQVRAVLLLVLAGSYTALLIVPAYQYRTVEKPAREKAEAEAAAFAKEARAYFHKKCAEDSGRFIYKTVTEPQESVVMMKPRKEATPKELRDQFWMGDPYGATAYLTDIPELTGLLKQTSKTANGNVLPLLSFVETHDLDHPDQLWRYYPTDYQHPDDTCPLGEKWFKCKPAESLQSRYGFTWDDLSTREDRYYWVAKSRLQIIDLQTKEVIAERIGYVIEGGFGSTAGYGSSRRPWKATEGGGSSNGRYWNVNYCPPRRLDSDTDWIRAVLNNLPSFDEK